MRYSERGGGFARTATFLVLLTMATSSHVAVVHPTFASTDPGGTTSGVQPPNDAEQTVRALVEQITAAYNRGDAAGVAAPFTANGVMIAGDGTRVSTPAAIEMYLATLMTNLPKGSTFAARVVDVRSLGSDAALLLSEGGFLMPGETAVTPAQDGVNGIVAVREGSTWRIALFQRTRRLVPKAAAAPST